MFGNLIDKWKKTNINKKIILFSWIITFILMITLVVLVSTLKKENREKRTVESSARWVIQNKTINSGSPSFYKEIVNKENKADDFDNSKMDDLLKKIGYDYTTSNPQIIYEHVGASKINNPGDLHETKSIELVTPKHIGLFIQHREDYANIIAISATLFILSLLFSIGFIVITKYKKGQSIKND